MSKINEIESKNSIKSLVNESTSNSTVHGLANLFRPNKSICLKLMWAFFILTSASGFSFVIVNTINNYLAYEVFSKLSIVNEVPMTFPAITICNSNPYTTSESLKFIEEFIRNDTFLSELSNSSRYEVKSEFLEKIYEFGNVNRSSEAEVVDSYQNYGAFKYFLTLYLRSSNVSDETLKSLSRPFNSFLIVCTFENFPCKEEDFEWYFDILKGNCYRFNTGRNMHGESVPIRKTSRFGVGEGLHLQLYTGIPDDFLTLATTVGIHVTITDNFIVPATFDGIDLPSGFMSNVAIKKQISKKLPKPYSDCVNSFDSSDSGLIDSMRKYYPRYRQTDCLLFCKQKLTIQICNCSNIDAPQLDFELCKTYEQSACATVVFLKIANGLGECNNICQVECDSVSFSTIISSNVFPSHSYADKLAQLDTIKNLFPPNETLSCELLKENLAAVNLYFEDSTYMLIEEKAAMNPSDLVANLGGTMGLFLGMSFLSLVEFVDFIIQLVFILLAKIGSKNKRKVASSK